MFSEASFERIAKMTHQERRWFNNVKKAFYESDLAFR
jgi:hypothetical protein